MIPYKNLLNVICEELDIKKGEKILEAGSGTGNLALEIKKRGADVIALDNIKIALEIHKERDNKASVFLWDLTNNLPFSNNYFNKICSNNTIYTISKKKRDNLVKEFYRILKPGGKIVLSNIHKKFSPKKIYLDHIKYSIKHYGFLKTLKDIFLMSIPSLKMFFYNFKIKKEDKKGEYDFIEKYEQKELFKKAGFINISENKKVYSNQAILNSAYKQ